MVTAGEMRKGLTVNLDGDLVRVLEYQHIKQGRGSAFVRLQMRNLRTGSITERTFQATSRFQLAPLERSTIQYQYNDGPDFYFMNTETYDQLMLNKTMLGDAVKYLRENDTIDLLSYGDEPLSVELSTTVSLRVTDTEPGVRGDTATGATKPATVETGLVVTVPLFVNEGDTIKIDTRTGEYLTRV
ncbi:MAG: elongation factor P [Chloroflexi bacterium]|nr:elongation factor P [Chloroflexota bacterium]